MAGMSSRSPCLAWVATAAAFVALGTISNAASVSSKLIQNQQEISGAIQELTEAVTRHLSYKSEKTVVEALQSQQKALIQFLSKGVGTSQQCQTMKENLAVSIDELKANQVSQQCQTQECQAMKDNLAVFIEGLKANLTQVSQQCQTQQCMNDNLAVFVEELKANLAQVSQDMEAAVERVANLEMRLQNQSRSEQAAVDRATAIDQRLRKVEAIASQNQEASHDIKDKLQTCVEASSKGSCRSPFYQVGVDCLYVHFTSKLSWDKARLFCRALGGDLAVPYDVLKLREFLLHFGQYDFWIGGTDSDTEGVWRWLNGSRVDSSVGWAPGQPDNFLGIEDCFGYSHFRDSYLNDMSCTTSVCFVCQDVMY